MLSYIPYLVLFTFALFFVLFFSFGIDSSIAFFRSIIVFFVLLFITYGYRVLLKQVVNPERLPDEVLDDLIDIGGEADNNKNENGEKS
jgi:hypothetical protein